MAYIESHQELGAHPKTKKAARLLSVSVPAVIGHLQLLWWWALDYAQDGDITAFDPQDIADAVMWPTAFQGFIDGLLGCGVGTGAGFLERSSDGRLLIHDWNDYAGKLIQKRFDNRERMRLARASNVQRTDNARAGLEKSNVEKSNVENLKLPLDVDEFAKKAAERGTSADFERFYAAYPNKKNPGAAFKTYAKVTKIHPHAKIMAGLDRALNSQEWAKDEGRYIPYPASWLNADGFDSEYKPIAPFSSPVSAPDGVYIRERDRPRLTSEGS